MSLTSSRDHGSALHYQLTNSHVRAATPDQQAAAARVITAHAARAGYDPDDVLAALGLKDDPR